jgi:hypothetical protein
MSLLNGNLFLTIARQLYRLLNRAKLKAIFVHLHLATFNLYYIIRKDKGRDLALEFLREIVTLCQVATVDSNAINMALTINFRDFEDAIKYSTAVLNNFNVIVTRNPNDFPVTSPRIMTPQQLIQEFTNSE